MLTFRSPFAGFNRIRFQGFALNPAWDTPGGLNHEYSMRHRHCSSSSLNQPPSATILLEQLDTRTSAVAGRHAIVASSLRHTVHASDGVDDLRGDEPRCRVVGRHD